MAEHKMQNSAVADKEEDYGLIRPSLLKQLKSILDQYPDNGQILKELLQNAEDAGAKNVKFVYDKHSYGRTHLHHPDLAAFQGPALYAYNDALFTEQDWTGIRMLQDSIKETDSMKIGRFGLGFKSVFHMTDLPSLLSGEKLFFIDPHERYFLFQGDRTSGYMWNLVERRSEIRRIPHQFAPFTSSICGSTMATLAAGSYPGTLFRFPLRQTASELSSTAYGADRIDALLTQFESDARLLLIFLKNVESLEVSVRQEDKTEAKVIFRVNISQSCIDEVRRGRCRFVDAVRGRTADTVSATYLLVIETAKYEADGSVQEKSYRYLVNELFSGGHGSKTLKELKDDPSLSLVPLVGTAVDVDGSPIFNRQQSTSVDFVDPEAGEGGEPGEKSVSPSGQVFCFLPLAMQEKSATGFPVHVNGYFAVSQNRQHLKWPSVGQKVESDKCLLWNRCLISELLPQSYCELVLTMTQSKLFSAKDIYAAMPNVIDVDEKWQAALEPLYRTLFNHPVFFSQQRNGASRWVCVKDCVFECLRREDTETRSLVVSTLVAANITVAADVSPHLLLALGAFSQLSPEMISPGLLRTILRRNPSSYDRLSRPAKLRLLVYLLKDEDFRDMDGLELIPLADGNFARFVRTVKGTTSNYVYMPTVEFPGALLPTLEKLLVELNDLDDLLRHKLTKLAQEGGTQVTFLTKDTVVSLLPKVIPKSWYQQFVTTWDIAPTSPIPSSWLPCVWLFFRTHFPSNLSPFVGLPILPLTSTESTVKLVPLTLNGCVILRSAIGSELSAGVAKVLELFGACIADDLPQYVRDHAAIIGNYVRLPIAEDIVDAMFSSFQLHGRKNALDSIRINTSEEEKADIRELVSRIQPRALEACHFQFLRKLPIFKCSGGSEAGGAEHAYCSVEQVGRAAPVNQLPIKSHAKYIDVSNDENATKAAALLGTKFINVTTALSELLTTEFGNGFPDSGTADMLAESIFANFSAYNNENPQIATTLSKIPFVKVCGNSNSYAAPSSLFDPDCPGLRTLLADADVFPGGDHASPNNLRYLRQMGLKTTDQLTAQDLLKTMIRIESLARSVDTFGTARSSSLALIGFLDKSPNLLWHDVDGRLLLKWASNLCWVAAVSERPASFPMSLPWAGSDDTLHVTAAVVSKEWTPVVGAVQPVVSCGTEVARAFGWDLQPELVSVVRQLVSIVSNYRSSEKAQYLTQMVSVYDTLSRADARQLLTVLDKLSLRYWVWHGDGFTSVGQTVLRRPAIDMRPYVYVLPSEMLSFGEFLRQCGVRERCELMTYVRILQKLRLKYSTEDSEPDDIAADTQLAISLLNELAQSPVRDEQISNNILILCQSNDEVPSSSLLLLPIADCTYCDVDWLRRGFDITEFDSQDGITFVHPQLPTATAAALGVPTLMSRMLHAEELTMISFGQSEPLTDRLRKLLEDYSDGLAIPKEIIQNADDAGASEVRFLYDERTNDESMKYLIDEGMRCCQGPALWAYNDAVFTERDFESIIRLGGAMKESEPEKIGKFGLGFNAVYNITDVPSFVTRDVLVIFDPHTTHLGRGIKDRSRPGIRINLQKNRMLLRRLPDQFRPYEDVFGCHFGSGDGDTIYFDGTLFRLPLRTREQATRSEISSVHYDRDQVKSLVQLTANSAHHLLTFTQNVQHLSFYHLAADGDPAEPHLILDITKGMVKVIRELTPVMNWTKKLAPGAVKTEERAALSRNCGMLHAAAEFVNSVGTKGRKTNIEPPRSSIVLKMSVKVEEDTSLSSLALKLAQSSETYWLVSSCVGAGISLEIARKVNGGFAPAAGVACELQLSGDNHFVPKSLGSGTNSRARAYCYLPLPVQTGLPVHINGVFALHSNRRHLSHVTEDEKTSARVEWNRALLEDAVTDAYIQLLVGLHSVLPVSDIILSVCDLWPMHNSVDPYFSCLVRAFYERVVSSGSVPLLYRNGNSATFADVIFLEQSLAGVQSIGVQAVKVLSRCSPGKTVSILPDAAYKSFVAAGLEDAVREKLYSLNRFFLEIFFPNLPQIAPADRDPLLQYVLFIRQPALEAEMMKIACIPSSPDGSVLHKPCELIHPECKVAVLYSPEDGRFPLAPTFHSPATLQSLERLGLIVGEISWSDVVERCSSLMLTWKQNRQLGKKRQRMLLLCIDQLLIRVSKADLPLSSTLTDIPFLSVMPKSVDFPVHWAGDAQADELMCASDLFTADNRYLVSATCCIVDEQGMSTRVRDFLQIGDNVAMLEHVITQLEYVLITDVSKLTLQQYNELQRCLCSIYQFLQERCATDENTANQVREAVADRPCILLDKAFVHANQAALEFPFNCAPYLYGLPTDFASRFRPLMTLFGVKPQFAVNDYMSVLGRLNEESGGKPLDEGQLDVAVRVLTQLNNTMKRSNVTAADVEQEHGPVLVPNAAGCLCTASSLCYNDCPWLTDATLVSFAHPNITYPTSACLGVRTKRQEALRRYARGIPFGQKERLTNSLRRLLDSYPFDHEVLKELVQNADDAGATEIHFVADWRQHPDTRVFESSWRPLQGPALCVYNNRPFSDADLEGIQRFGEGSKTSDPSATGQYGVGFSSIYHLTDAPLLLTTRLDGSKMLCVFDPLCRYVPGATEAEPGMRYDDIQALRAAFPDVFSCFMEQQFSDGGTIFRFPLRTPAMADVSTISKTVVKPSRIMSIFEQLRSELFEILLFTNHLEKISISEVDTTTGLISNTYTISMVIGKYGNELRQDIANAKRTMAADLKANSFGALQNEKPVNSHYTMTLVDNRGCQEKWIVAHRLGFEVDVKIPADVATAFDNNELALLPHGGVACLVERRVNGRIDAINRPCRAFCFLPLPVETDLPVHINGHFALGYENRRHLWTNADRSGYKRQWNDLLCANAVAPAYAELLAALRLQSLSSKKLGSNLFSVTCSRAILDSSLQAYMAFFPGYSETRPQWSVLTTAVYLLIDETEAALLASVFEVDAAEHRHMVAAGPQATEAIQWQITWLPPTGNDIFFRKWDASVSSSDSAAANASSSSLIGKFKNWFGLAPTSQERSTEEVLSEVLLGCGLKLVECTSQLYDNFCRAGVDVQYMTAESVLSFFETYGDEDSACQLGPLPQPIENTPFRNEKMLLQTLNYIKTAGDFSQRIDGLPLLLKADGTLDCFRSDKPVYVSEFNSLLHGSEGLFVNSAVANLLGLAKNEADKTNIIRDFGIDDLASQLPSILPVEKFCNDEGFVEWKRTGSETIPNVSWLQKLWTFVATQLNKMLSDVDGLSREERVTLVKDAMEPLNRWCIVPVRTPAGYCHLYSPDAACSKVVHVRGDHDQSLRGINFVIQCLQFPELDVVSMHGEVGRENDPVRDLVVTLEKPYELLRLLSERFSEAGKNAASISKDGCSHLLKYFTSNVDTLAKYEDSAEMIRSLPIFTTICGDTIRLSGCLVYTLPAKIPTKGIDVWQSRSGTVFLARNETFEPLYDFMGCASIGPLDVYCQFIFQHFEYFAYEDRLVHLHHVYTNYLQNNRNGISELEHESLVESLRNLAFIEDENGELQQASYFYDPENVVFRVMQPASKFAPRADRLFKESEWYSFLALLGMVRLVTPEKFLEFVRVVAAEGNDPQSASAVTKSKVLVQHLFASPDLLSDGILDDIADIAFIVPEKASSAVKEISPQHGDIGNDRLCFMPFRNSVSKEYEKICWTSASLLPQWADPQHCQLHEDEKDFITDRLHVQKKPSFDTVLRHLETICTSANLFAVSHAVKMDVFRAIYRFFDGIDISGDLKEQLQKIRCILVEDGRSLVRPRQTVLNMYDTDEIRPYLYRLPLDLGEHRRLFVALGTTDRATVAQYAEVLSHLREDCSASRLLPNELVTGYRAVRGLLEALEVTPASVRDVTVPCLYLPSDDGRLVDAERLVFNDAPAFYDRVREFNLHFVVDLRECGVHLRSVEDTLAALPGRLRPSMLSTIVQETLVEESRRSVSKTRGVAGLLGTRLKSEQFQQAIVRLIRHEAFKSGRNIDEAMMFGVLDRLSTISVFTAPCLMTHLILKGKPISGSQVEKSCFVERTNTGISGVFQWNIYIKDDGNTSDSSAVSLSQDLLISLAEVINDILSGILRDSVLYLLPALSCPDPDGIAARMDHLNIRMDHSQKSAASAKAGRATTLPPVGSKVDENIQKFCVGFEEGRSTSYRTLEYVGYRERPDGDIIYGQVIEELMSPDDVHIYLLDLGNGQNGVISSATKMCKFVRK